MKKLEKLSLKELEGSSLVLDHEQVKRLKGGDGSDYPYYSPGEAYCIAQGPGYIGTVGELQREQASYNSLNSYLSWINVGISITGGIVGLGQALVGLGIGIYSSSISIYATTLGENAQKLGIAVDSLQNMGFNPDTKIRIEYLDSYFPGVSEGGTCRLRVWNAETGQLIYETHLNN